MSAEPPVRRGEAAELPVRARGVLALTSERCTACMACARECPTWCIDIDAHLETSPATTPRGRARSYHVLDRFVIDLGLCMYCGVCVEVCPFDALSWAPQYTAAAADRDGLRHDRDQLSSGAGGGPSPGSSPPAARPEGGNTCCSRGR